MRWGLNLLTRRPDPRRAYVEALSKTLIGVEAIYMEVMIVQRVWVREMTVDHWGVRLLVDVVPAKGMFGPCGPIKFTAAWDALGVLPMSMAAPVIPWSLHWHPALVADILDFAETLPVGGGDAMRNYFKLASRIASWQRRIAEARP